MEKDLRKYVREVDNFPENGVKFYDIAPLLGNGAVFAAAVREMAEPLRGNVDKVVGFDARGFLFGAAIANELGVGMAMLRKPGKLPGDVARVDYALEYGVNSLELQSDAIARDERVVLVDDVIATGGTALAGIELVRSKGGNIVGFSALIDLPHLGGSKKISEKDIAVHAVMELGE
jgi:adenine phosphoribosyltransferase